MQLSSGQFKPSEKQRGEATSKQNEDTGRVCSNCQSKVSDSADICENCGAWQLPLQCCFCYSEVEEGQKFCSECGNPPFGSICNYCGTKSYFDFCPNCNNPKTEQATATLEQVKESFAVEVFSVSPETLSIPKVDDGNIPVLDNKTAIIPKSNPNKLVFHGSRNSANNLKAVEEASQLLKAEENKKLQKVKETELIARLKANQKKKFENNQEARKYFDSLKLILPKVVDNRKLVGWLCNFANVLHTEGPHNCGDPSQGGTWIYEGDIDIQFIQTEL